MNRPCGLALALMMMACGGSSDDPPGSPDAPSHADATSQVDAAVDAATADAAADASLGQCALDRTRQIVSLVADVPTCTPYGAEPVAVGTFCDDILTYASTPEQRALLEAAAPGFVCEASGYCHFNSTTGTGIVIDDDVMMQVCAATVVVEAGCYIDCLVYI